MTRSTAAPCSGPAPRAPAPCCSGSPPARCGRPTPPPGEKDPGTQPRASRGVWPSCPTATPWSASGSAAGSSGSRARAARGWSGRSPTCVANAGEGGLLGLVCSPDLPGRPAGSTPTSPPGTTTGWCGCATPAAGSRRPGGRARRHPARPDHNGGRLAFGPDGLLYATTGDSGDRALAGDTDSLAGKILRITPDGSVPDGNPFGNHVWTLGHRNVEGSPSTGAGRLWATEFGEHTRDELNRIVSGHDYGWPTSRAATAPVASTTRS